MSEQDFTFLLRGGTAFEWAAANPILEAREPGVETDTDRFKIGDGVRQWNSLPYYLSEVPLASFVQDRIQTGPEELPDLTLLWQNAKA